MSETIGAKQGPDYLYFKFRSINKHLIESLVNSSLYFARPDELNDPFDCRPDLRKSLLRAASLATGRQKSFLQSALNDGQKFIESWKARFESFGIWIYEHEARIIRGQHGLLNIPSGSLEQVCFGLDTPESDIDLVAKLASEHCGCKSFCRIIREDRDFGIAAKEI